MLDAAKIDELAKLTPEELVKALGPDLDTYVRMLKKIEAAARAAIRCRRSCGTSCLTRTTWRTPTSPATRSTGCTRCLARRWRRCRRARFFARQSRCRRKWKVGHLYPRFPGPVHGQDAVAQRHRRHVQPDLRG